MQFAAIPFAAIERERGIEDFVAFLIIDAMNLQAIFGRRERPGIFLIHAEERGDVEALLECVMFVGG